MKTSDFRKLALSFPEAVESAHMHHPDFRTGGKIFAPMGYSHDEWAGGKITPNEQRQFVRADAETFRAVKGVWGRRGNTNIYLPSASVAVVKKAVAAAHRNVTDTGKHPRAVS